MPTYNTVSVTGNNIFGNSSGEVVNVTFVPLSLYFDTVNNIEINAPTQTVTSNNAGAWTVSNLIDPTPGGTGMAWTILVTDKQSGQQLYNANVQIAYANGASQQWLALTPPPAPATTTTYLVATGAPTGTGQYLQSTAANSNVLTYAYGESPLNVRNFGADPTGVADSTTAIQNAINAATGNATPSTHSRQALNRVYLPTGSYKVSSDLLIQSVIGFVFVGDGRELTYLVASGTSGWTNGPLTVDGSYGGYYGGFTVKGDTTEQVNNAITLTYTTGANRSTTSNKFENIAVRNINSITGFNMAGVGSRQLDGTKLNNILLTGGQTALGTWSNTGNWQQGVVIGNGTFGNIYDQVLTGVDASQYYYGYYCNVSSFALIGAQPANNFADFWITPGAQCTITNIQSQNSGQFLIAPSSFSPIPNSFNDINFVTNYLQGASNAWMTITGGLWNFNNVSATKLVVGNNGSYVNGLITVNGAASNRPAVLNFEGLAMRGTKTGAFSIGGNPVYIVMSNYSNYEPTTGVYTSAGNSDVASIYNGGWETPVYTGTTAPDVQWYTATGSNTWNRPVGGQVTYVTLCGGGGGGGGGALSSASSLSGGGGGGGGAVQHREFVTSDLTTTVTVTVGAGGAGGAAVTATGSVTGNPGQAGVGTSFGSFTTALAGSGGGAGVTASSTAGAGGASAPFPGGAGAGGTVGAAGTNSGGAAGAPGGTSGGGCSNVSGFNGGATPGYTTLGSTTNHGAGGVVGGANPTTGTLPTAKGTPNGGAGGGAGASGATPTAQNGATGLLGEGGGGGGSGFITSGTGTSGAGGNGGPGFALVITFYQ